MKTWGKKNNWHGVQKCDTKLCGGKRLGKNQRGVPHNTGGPGSHKEKVAKKGSDRGIEGGRDQGAKMKTRHYYLRTGGHMNWELSNKRIKKKELPHNQPRGRSIFQDEKARNDPRRGPLWPEGL